MVSLFTRVPLGLVVLLLGGVLFARLASMAMSEALDEAQPSIAAALNGHNETARLRLAKAALESDPPDAGSGRSLAQEALRANPLSVSALQLLALAAEEEGRADDVGALMRQSASITLRNPLNQLWAFSHVFQGAGGGGRLPVLDRIYASTVGFGRIEPNLHLMIGDDAGLVRLASALALNPPWRGQALTSILRHTRQPERSLALFDLLAATPSPPNVDEVRPLLASLVAAGRLDDAQGVWRAHIAPLGGDPNALMPNASFEAGLLDMPFEWSVRPDPLAAARLSRENRRRILNVEFFGGRVAAKPIGRLLNLPAGSYALRGVERAVGLSTPRGLVWRIFCVGQSKALAETSALNADTGWRAFEARFIIPDECRYQMLELSLAARAPSEQEIQGLVSYADFSLERVE